MKKFLALLMVLVIMFTQTSVILAGAETSDADLIGKWSFNEEGGDTVYDLSGNGADLHADWRRSYKG